MLTGCSPGTLSFPFVWCVLSTAVCFGPGRSLAERSVDAFGPLQRARAPVDGGEQAVEVVLTRAGREQFVTAVVNYLGGKWFESRRFPYDPEALGLFRL